MCELSFYPQLYTSAPRRPVARYIRGHARPRGLRFSTMKSLQFPRFRILCISYLTCRFSGLPDVFGNMHHLVQLRELFRRHLERSVGVWRQQKAFTAYLFVNCGVEFLASVSVSVRTSWQLIQVHLPLSKEPHYVHWVCDILVPTEL